MTSRSSPDQYAYEERAAIMEYCGELPREEAEKLAKQPSPKSPHDDRMAKIREFLK